MTFIKRANSIKPYTVQCSKKNHSKKLQKNRPYVFGIEDTKVVMTAVICGVVYLRHGVGSGSGRGAPRPRQAYQP